MIDMPNVFKLGKGPEHGHVNCSIFIPFNFFDTDDWSMSSYEGMIKITGKMSRLSMFNYLDLHMSVGWCMIRLTTNNKEKTHGT
jgi:hypothetical protein